MTDDEKLIESMARAMGASKAWPVVYDAGSAHTLAQAALASIRETHAVVPREPTPQIIAAGWANLKRSHLPRIGPGPGLVEAYCAMIAAAEGEKA